MSDSKIQDMSDEYRYTYDAWNGFLNECENDFKFYLNDQWNLAEREKLLSENRPAIVLNVIKKSVDVIDGHQRQNVSDIKFFPVEGSDQERADIYSEVTKWILTNTSAHMIMSDSFLDTIIGGLGWFAPQISYNNDIIDGEIEVVQESPFRVYGDPEMTRRDLGDCNYIYRHAWLSKNSIISLYPDFEKDIKSITSGNKSLFHIQKPHNPNNKTHLSVIEKWYREYERKTFIVDTVTQEVREWTGSRKDLEVIKKKIEESPTEPIGFSDATFGQLTIIERRVPRIKLTTVVEDHVIVYDDDNPYEINMYPIIPIFGFHIRSFNDWKWKLQGFVRALKDPQRERNKRRSQVMDVVLSQAQSGYIGDENALVDPTAAKNATGGGVVIEKRKGYELKQITPPPLPSAIVALDRMFYEDVMAIGLNPDLLGIGERQDAGIVLQLRQKQGITSIQGMLDNLTYAKIMFGRYMVELINKHFSTQKIERIIGRELPPDWDELKHSARYDCIVDETVHSPTYRMTNFMIMVDLYKQGFMIPPEILIDLSDLPQTVKQQLHEYLNAEKEKEGMAQQAAMAPPPTEMSPAPQAIPGMM